MSKYHYVTFSRRLNMFVPKKTEEDDVRFQVDERKIAIFNTAMQIVGETAKEIAASRSFGHHESGNASFAADWLLTYDRDAYGMITAIDLSNTLVGGEHEGGADTEMLWDIMESGRKLTARKSALRAKVVTSRFRTDRQMAFVQFIGPIPALQPVEAAQAFLNEMREELVDQLIEARWGGYKNNKPRAFVRALPKLYESYYKKSSRFDTVAKTGMAVNSGQFGDYGGTQRKNIFYKLSK